MAVDLETKLAALLAKRGEDYFDEFEDFATAVMDAISYGLAATSVWTFNDETDTSLPPTTGQFTLNNLFSATNMAIHRASADSGNPVYSGWITSWDDGGAAGNYGLLYLTKVGAPTVRAIFKLTSTITNNTTWFRFSVTAVANLGAPADGEQYTVTFIPSASLTLGSSVTASTGAALGLDDSVTSEGTTPLPLHFDGDTDTGLVRTAANAMSLVTGGFGAVRCSSTEVSLRPDLATFAAGNASRPAHLGVNNNVSGSNVIVYAISTGTDCGHDNVTKNAGPHNFWTGATSGFSGAVRQFSVPHTASADRYGTVTGGVSGSGTCVTMSTSGGDLNFDPASTATVRITGLPLASAGLASGALWNNSGVLNVA